MINKEEIDDEALALRIHRALDYIYSAIRENGEISQFKEDVMIIINILLEKQLNKEELTACEIAFKNQQSRIQIEKEKYIQRKIEQLEADLYEANNIINDYIEDRQKLINYLEKEIEVNRKEMNNTNIKLNQIHFMKRIEYAKEILEMAKGEKNE
ncbi:MAG: hypothetical protein HFJ49_03055 [Clostridia bacterium]|jgi:hypothetical protein|nr:hypothetical protein [Clostridia bacterium]